MPTRTWSKRCGVVLLLVLIIAGLPYRTVFAAAAQVKTQAPGYYRLMIGDFEVTALLDGTHPFQDAALLTKGRDGSDTKRPKLFDVDAPEAARLLARAAVSAPTEGSVNAFLVNTGSKLVLIDSGVGMLYGKCCGRLMENLRAAGYRPEQVDYVFVTHLHRDHVGGIAPNGIMAFPNAIIRVSQADADYWLSGANETMASEYVKPIFAVAKASLKPYLAAGHVSMFQGEQELVPGIRAIPSPGHTPGHTFYAIESRGQKLVVWGDVVHVAALQFADPSITVEYDNNEKQAESTRRTIFAAAAREGFLIAAAHISFPGIGHVGIQGQEYSWLPIEYHGEVDPREGAITAK